MTRLSLPVIDSVRTEFGFERTCCACPACVANCRHIPGYLIPADLARMAAVAREDELLAWCKRHLLASPGAIVAREGHVFRIPTLVPARRDDGACIFLTKEGACAVHATAPFGCAFFDAHMGPTQADRRSSAGLRAVAQAWQTGALYATVWTMLHDAGQVALAPEEARRRMHTGL